MRSLLLALAAAALTLAALPADSKTLARTTDRELKNLCFDWFAPTTKIVDGEGITIRHPEARKALESFPRQGLLDRLRRISVRPIHANDHSAIHFVLAYWGSTPVEDTRLMLLENDLAQEKPERVDTDLDRSPYRWMRALQPELSPGLHDSVVQLYQRRGSKEMMKVFFRWQTDGAASYGFFGIQGQLFRAAPYDYVQTARELNMRQRAAFYLTAEGTSLEYEETVKILDRIRADKNSGLSKSANVIRYEVDRIETAYRKWHG
jgi:hypothetical protein